VASLFRGLALANARVGAVYGFAGRVGGIFPALHGAVCAALLPHVMEMNPQALRHRAPQREALARILTGRAGATAKSDVECVRELVRNPEAIPFGGFLLRRCMIERRSR